MSEFITALVGYGFLVGLIGFVISIWLLVGFGRIWLYTKQTVQLLKQQNKILKKQLALMNRADEPESCVTEEQQ